MLKAIGAVVVAIIIALGVDRAIEFFRTKAEKKTNNGDEE